MGRAPEQLSVAERLALAGRFIALPIYTPQDAPFRRIAAIGGSAQECVQQLLRQGLDVSRFEFTRISPPF